MSRKKRDNYRMVVCSYEPVPLRMSRVHEAVIGGVTVTMEKGLNYLVPYFVVIAARQSYSVDHNMPQQKGEKSTFRIRKQKPTMVVTEIEDVILDYNEDFNADLDPEDYKGMEGVQKLIDLGKKVNNAESDLYGLQLGVDNIDYSALKRSASPEAIAEKQARSAAVKGAGELTNELVNARLKLKKSEETNEQMVALMARMSERLDVLEGEKAATPAPVAPPADEEEPKLSPQQKAAATRKANKEKEIAEE